MKSFYSLPNEADVLRQRVIDHFEELFERLIPYKENVGKWLEANVGDYYFLEENQEALIAYAKSFGYVFGIREGEFVLHAPKRYYVIFTSKEK